MLTKSEEKKRYFDSMSRHYGITAEDAAALRRIQLTLHRWSEMECNGVFQRDDVTGKPYQYYIDEYGTPTIRSRMPIADRERGAERRAEKIIAKYNDLLVYFQGDPRGCALYVVRKSDVPEGKTIDCYYSRGIACCY